MLGNISYVFQAFKANPRIDSADIAMQNMMWFCINNIQVHPWYVPDDIVRIPCFMMVTYFPLALSFRQCAPPKFNTAPGWEDDFPGRKITFQGPANC